MPKILYSPEVLVKIHKQTYYVPDEEETDEIIAEYSLPTPPLVAVTQSDLNQNTSKSIHYIFYIIIYYTKINCYDYVAANYLESKDNRSLETNSIQNNEFIVGACHSSLSGIKSVFVSTLCNYTTIHYLFKYTFNRFLVNNLILFSYL